MLLLPSVVLGRRPITGASLAPARPEALCLVHHPLLLRLGAASLPAQSTSQLLADRGALLEALSACVGSACTTMASVPSVSAHAATLQELLAEEMGTVPRDHEVWGLEAGEELDASAAARMLSAHLRSARGVFGQLGASAPLFRCLGWSHATLLGAGLDGGNTHAGWVHAHAERWTALADSCEAAFDGARIALDDGAIKMSLAGALSDLECSVALREAQTSSALLYDVLDGALASSAADDESDDEALQAAHDAIEAVESGYVASHTRTVFVAGRGRLDAGGQQTARRAAATSYLAAKLRRGLVQMDGDAGSASQTGRDDPPPAVDILSLVDKYFELGESDWAGPATLD